MPDVPEALRKRFVDGLAARWQTISLAGTPSECLQGLHRLAGASGSFGFEALGAAARSAEQSCSSSPDGWPEASLMDALREHLKLAGLAEVDTKL